MSDTISLGRSLAGKRFAVRDLANHEQLPATDDATLIILTTQEYQALLDRAEDAEDARLANEAAVSADPKDYLPLDAVDRLHAGEHPVRVWRGVRGLTLAQLGKAAGIVPSYISEIERGKKPGSIEAVQKLARVLRLDIEDLVLQPPEATR